MGQRLHFFWMVSIGLLVVSPAVWGQVPINTLELSVSSVCPGSPLTVPFTAGLSYGTDNTFTVQLSDGGDYGNLATKSLIYDSKKNLFTIVATVPVNQAAGATYRVRVVSSSPAVVGSPSATMLTIKPKPAPPKVDENSFACQVSGNADRALSYFYTLKVKEKESNTLLNWTRVDGKNICETTITWGGTGNNDVFKDNILIHHSCYPPDQTHRFYVSQQYMIDGCESDKVMTSLTIRPSPAIVPPTLTINACQNDAAIDLSKQVVAPNGYYYRYTKDNILLATVPVIETTQPTKAEYTTTVYSNDGCIGYNFVPNSFRISPSVGKVMVNVTARPDKPKVSAGIVSLCQHQQSNPLSASVTVSDASLVWYGTDATGGTGSASVSRPATTATGLFKYYVAQKVNDCEGERAEITVEIKKAPDAPVVLPEVINCQKADGSSNITSLISVTASSADAVTKLYDAFGQPANYVDRSLSSFVVPKPGTPGTTVYRVTQVVNGCESQSSEVKLIIKPKANVYARPVNMYSTTGDGQWGKIEYCQGSPAKSIIDYGIEPLPENITVSVIKRSGDIDLETDNNLYAPKTDKAGTAIFGFMTYLDGCPATLQPHNQLIVTVKTRPAKPTVSATAPSVCQNQLAEPLNASVTADGASLVWYDTNATGGIGSAVASVPVTKDAGTFTYYVAQKLNDCESERVEMKVLVKPTPDAPGVQAVAVCQNEAVPLLQPSGQNLLWYAASTGGTGSATIPAISTSQASQNTYYVSQSQDGCESRRAALSVTVNATPSVPRVESVGPTYCQNAKADPLAATGEGLKWYRESSGGTPLGSSVTPETSNGGNFTYYVSQTIKGCEGSRSGLTVKVVALPSVPTATTAYSYCQGVLASALSATGTDLMWYDGNGKSSNTAPTPSTDAPGTVSYAVTQRIEGCESPRVAIRVFVQTTPTLNVEGTATINLGLEVPLKLTFTGVGPYQYKLSGGLSGTATKDTTVLVVPERTITYQVVEVTNRCGIGQAVGSATVSVLVPIIQTLAFSTTSLCVGSTFTAGFSTSGSFNPGSAFRLQIAAVEADSSQAKFADLPNTVALNEQLTGVIPTTMAAGTYWVRAMATNPKIPVLGSISPTRLTLKPIATATLANNSSIYEGQPARLSVTLTGDAPWTFAYRDSTATGVGAEKVIQTDRSPYALELMPSKTTAYYLTTVSNVCGSKSVAKNLILVTVMPLLSVEDPLPNERISVYPIPTISVLTIDIRGLSASQPAVLELTDATGRTIWQATTQRETTTLPLDQQAAGTYLLRIRVGNKTATRRILKL